MLPIQATSALFACSSTIIFEFFYFTSIRSILYILMSEGLLLTAKVEIAGLKSKSTLFSSCMQCTKKNDWGRTNLFRAVHNNVFGQILSSDYLLDCLTKTRWLTTILLMSILSRNVDILIVGCQRLDLIRRREVIGLWALER